MSEDIEEAVEAPIGPGRLLVSPFFVESVIDLAERVSKSRHAEKLSKSQHDAARALLSRFIIENNEEAPTLFVAPRPPQLKDIRPQFDWPLSSYANPSNRLPRYPSAKETGILIRTISRNPAHKEVRGHYKRFGRLGSPPPALKPVSIRPFASNDPRIKSGQWIEVDITPIRLESTIFLRDTRWKYVLHHKGRPSRKGLTNTVHRYTYLYVDEVVDPLDFGQRTDGPHVGE